MKKQHALTVAFAIGFAPLLAAWFPSAQAVLIDTAQTITATKTLNKASQISTAETLAVLSVSDDASSKIDVVNGTTTDAFFNPTIRAYAGSTRLPLAIYGHVASDSGSQPAVNIDGRTATNTAISTRPILTVSNLVATKFQVGANGDLAIAGTTSIVTAGSGTPEGAKSAPLGSLYLRTDGGAGTTLYIKESGTGNTGWVAK